MRSLVCHETGTAVDFNWMQTLATQELTIKARENTPAVVTKQHN